MLKRIALAVVLCLLCAVPCMADGIININTATVEQLLSIPDTNMTKEQAQAIVDYVKAHGPFKMSDEVLKVPGMSNEVWQRMMLKETENGDLIYDPNSEDMPTFAPSKC